MKKFLSVYGCVLFLLMMCLLLEECISIIVKTTCFMALIGIALGVLYNKLYIIITVSNLIISILVLITHEEKLFSDAFYFVDSLIYGYYMINWTLYICFSVLGMIMFCMYFLLRNEECSKKRIKKIVNISIVSAVILFIIYLISCVYLSLKINKLADASYETYGQLNNFEDIISHRNFRMMNDRDDETKDHPEAYEEYWHSFPISLIFFNKAVSWYWYDYNSDFNSTKTDLLFPVKVYSELKNFRWIITNVSRMP